MAKSIDVSDLDIYYGDFHAVESVSMTIPARSVTALIGPSGCGKSTFLRSLNRMHEVIPGARVEGKVMVDGQSLYDPSVDPVEVRRLIGMVFGAATDSTDTGFALTVEEIEPVLRAASGLDTTVATGGCVA